MAPPATGVRHSPHTPCRHMLGTSRPARSSASSKVSPARTGTCRADAASRARNGSRGDQYVEIQIVVPDRADVERLRPIMKELETLAPGDPRKDLFTKAGV